ncbi:exonuclease domain-containing protein [Gammaproteobacteria bacterium]|nr:exonuclease domain-containing protein [Gammaproteobacteria bacterium]
MSNDNNLIFYDTETTGIQRDFSQILQCGSVLTDGNLNTLGEQNISCAPLPWVIPAPRAMLTNKKIDLFNSNVSHYQMMKDLQMQWKQWSAKNPAIFVSYNGHAFDEELVRRQFFWNLLEPYTTNTNGNGRLDLMLMIHNIAAFFSDEISMPLFEGGPGISYKLEHLALEHGIDAGDAHDAIADCNLMIEMCKIINEKLPELFQSFIDISTKPGVKNLLYSDDFLALGEIHRRHTFRYPVVMCGGDASRPNEIVFYDLSYDPDDILDLDFTEINKLVKAKGRDGPLKKYKINKTIPICSHKLLTNPDAFDMEFSELQRRADIVRSNKDFQSKVSQAMEDRMMDFPESEFIEGTIYSGGFPSNRDKDLMQEFHITDDPAHLIKISRNFSDDRLRLFAERIICYQYPSEVPEDVSARYQDLIDERSDTDGLWGSVDKSLAEIDKLLDEMDGDEEQTILKATRQKIQSMKRA